MPVKKTTKKSLSSSLVSKLPRVDGNKETRNQIRVYPPVYLKVLATIFFIIWILVGLFMLLFIYGNVKQGAFDGLFRERSAQTPPQMETPTETTLPGIGKVNISCVQALGDETIQKILNSGTKDLTDEENSKLEPCIVEKEEASPSSSPAQ